jgi:hypothetical protein
MKFSGMQPMRLDETCIREMLGSSLGHNTSIQVDILRGIPQSQESNAGMSPQVGNDRFVPNSLQLRHLVIRRYIVSILTTSLGNQVGKQLT